MTQAVTLRSASEIECHIDEIIGHRIVIAGGAGVFGAMTIPQFGSAEGCGATHEDLMALRS
jgi:NAD-dependent SIR2 family protein deacetylase